MARIFGAPVTEPGGKIARKRSPRPTSSLSVALTPEVNWWSVLNVSTVKRSVTDTLPISAMRPRSLRMRSTIMRFSARCFTSLASVRRASASASAVLPRGAVPFIGRVEITHPSCSMKSSGLAESTVTAPVSTMPP